MSSFLWLRKLQGDELGVSGSLAISSSPPVRVVLPVSHHLIP